MDKDNDKRKPYFLINPDYEGCLGFFSGNLYYCCCCENDVVEFDGYDGKLYKVPGIEEWCWEWDCVKWGESHGVTTDFNWEIWHKRGLHLAQILRQQVGDEIDILYRKDDENIEIEKFHYFCLSPDTCNLIGETNLYSICYDEDILELGHFSPFPLEGLDQWWRDFDSHVDYVDTWADPDYDWMSWYCRGLEMAKKIRSNLPESVEVWYRIPYELKGLLPIPDVLVRTDGSFLIGDFLSRKDK